MPNDDIHPVSGVHTISQTGSDNTLFLEHFLSFGWVMSQKLSLNFFGCSFFDDIQSDFHSHPHPQSLNFTCNPVQNSRKDEMFSCLPRKDMCCLKCCWNFFYQTNGFIQSFRWYILAVVSTCQRNRQADAIGRSWKRADHRNSYITRSISERVVCFLCSIFFWVKGSVWGQGNAGSFGTLWRGYFMNAKQSLRHL